MIRHQEPAVCVRTQLAPGCAPGISTVAVRTQSLPDELSRWHELVEGLIESSNLVLVIKPSDQETPEVLLAPTPIGEQIRTEARRFLNALREHNYDTVWNYLISTDSLELIATASFPLFYYSQGTVDAIIQADLVEGFSFAFQTDAVLSPTDEVGIRTGFFEGLQTSLESMGWLEGFLDDGSYVFLDQGNAVVFADSADTKQTIILPLILDTNNQYKVDLEALTVFSMIISAQKLHKFATRTREAGELRVSLEMYRLCARLKPVYGRLKALTWDHSMVGKSVTEERKAELDSEYGYTLLAEVMVDEILADPTISVPTIDLVDFIESVFNGFDQITSTYVSAAEIEAVLGMDDAALRASIAEILVGVNRVEARRESRKPHTSAEIADMEVLVRHGSDMHHLLMPVKSGREIKQSAVPVEVFYQILRPHMFFKHGIVVFITAKPCSQFLMNYIKQARDSVGWPIAVIEGEDLARLLKINGQLPTEAQV